MDLFTLKKNLQAQKYDSLGGFVKDFELMCENSINYNLPGSSHSKVPTIPNLLFCCGNGGYGHTKYQAKTVQCYSFVCC